MRLGLWTLLGLLRALAVVIVVFRIAAHWPDYAGTQRLGWYALAIFIYLVNVAYWSHRNAQAPQHPVSEPAILLQLVLDVLAFSLFYLLGEDPRSDLFILYLLVLMAAARYLQAKIVASLLAMITVAFAAVLLGMAHFFRPSFPNVLWRVFVPREMFLILMTTANVFRYGQTEAVERQASLKEYIASMSREFVERTDLDGLHAFIVNSGAKFLNAEDCSLYVSNEQERTIDFVASSHLPPGLFSLKKTPVSAEPGSGLTAYVAATGEILRFVGREFQRHPAWRGEFKDHLKYFRSGRCESLLLVPMKKPDGEIVGVLKAENKLGLFAESGFSAFDKQLLTSLADQAATQIEHVARESQIREEAVHAERKRLGDELHEALNILHAGVMIGAEVAQYWLSQGEHSMVQAGLGRLWRASRYAYGEFSNILQDLRDPILEREGLAAALQNYCEKIGHDLVEAHCDLPCRLKPRIEHALFRVAQGAISNAIRHAGLHLVKGRKACVELTLDGENLILRVRDNGKGFDKASIPTGGPVPYGLRRMEEWARIAGGVLDIQSGIGEGTVITFTRLMKGATVEEQDQSSAGG